MPLKSLSLSFFLLPSFSAAAGPFFSFLFLQISYLGQLKADQTLSTLSLSFVLACAILTLVGLELILQLFVYGESLVVLFHVVLDLKFIHIFKLHPTHHEKCLIVSQALGEAAEASI